MKIYRSRSRRDYGLTLAVKPENYREERLSRCSIMVNVTGTSYMTPHGNSDIVEQGVKRFSVAVL